MRFPYAVTYGLALAIAALAPAACQISDECPVQASEKDGPAAEVTVTAAGGRVRIESGQSVLEADEITFDPQTGRITATAAAPPYEEVEAIGVKGTPRFESLTAIALARDGRLLACDGATSTVHVLSPEGKAVAAWRLDFAPHAIHPHDDGTFYAGGPGVVARLDASGKATATLRSNGQNFPEDAPPAGIATSGQDLFVSYARGSRGVGGIVVRMDLALSGAATIVEGLRGCCGNLDIAARDGRLYVAENARHRVIIYDRAGQQVAAWGQADREGLEGFGSCCNPMNVLFGPDGSLYTSESAINRIKRFTPEGKFLGLVGYVGIRPLVVEGQRPNTCYNADFVISPDGLRVFVLDENNNVIRVLQKKAEARQV